MTGNDWKRIDNNGILDFLNNSPGFLNLCFIERSDTCIRIKAATTTGEFSNENSVLLSKEKHV